MQQAMWPKRQCYLSTLLSDSDQSVYEPINHKGHCCSKLTEVKGVFNQQSTLFKQNQGLYIPLLLYEVSCC